jgi:hypothetical protein
MREIAEGEEVTLSPSHPLAPGPPGAPGGGGEVLMREISLYAPSLSAGGRGLCENLLCKHLKFINLFSIKITTHLP